ncbi:uncharacterized protein LOC110665079 [Hevea brasiliensis]|uniref:uncharacterized protein LOC110665079 n=1 Tax=Hevea brasiliensis TaxID=3981 RepID=UPI0025D0DD9B|nr:uncharacterized protein LOC110665079 [Hevea brasiliensis]
MKYSEISHFSHPLHPLKFEYSEFPFKCDGCKEVGIGSRYKCSKCDFDLHMHCAIPSASIFHPFYNKCSFQFLSRPPGDKPRYCNACERDVNGFLYHCNDCGFDLHPCCAKLPMVLDDGEVKLYLYRKVSETCHKCGRKGRSWSYRSSCKKYNLHVACVKDMLVENWAGLYLERSDHHRGNTSSSYANGNGSRKLENRIPSLKNALQTHHRKSKGKVQKCCEMAGLAVQFVISAVLGDPTTIIAGVIGNLIARG